MPSKILKVNGYEVSVTFAENRNPTVVGQVKQILLSSFVARGAKARPKGILVCPSEQRYNIGGGSPDVP